MRRASPWCDADLPTSRATPLHRYYHSPVGLPSCVTPSLAYCQSGSRAPQHTGHKRSEEHTSELQSRQYLVCRLLLEKKKNDYYLCIHVTNQLMNTLII